MNLGPAAYLGDPVQDRVGNAESRGTLSWIEARAAIQDSELDAAADCGHADDSRGNRGMLGDVGERFSGGSAQRFDDMIRQRVIELRVDVIDVKTRSGELTD